MDLEKARRKRGSNRGATTRLLTKIKEALDDDNRDEVRLQVHLTDLKDKIELLKNLDKEIFDTMIDQEADQAACDQEMEEACEIKERATYNLAILEKALKDMDVGSIRIENESVAEVLSQASETKDTGHLSRSTSRESLISRSSNQSTEFAARRVKLPKLELKKFSGNIAEWQEFWDGFKSAVHDDVQLAKVDKFKYLRSYLAEPARSVVTGFALTDRDYDSAIGLLRSRYAKPGVIKRAHINELLNLAPVFNERSVQRLRNLRDQIETHFRAMEAQGVSKESYSSVVVPVLMGKIPETLRNNMIRFGTDHMDWNLDDMLMALGKELDVLEGHFPIMQNHQQQTGRRNDHQGNKHNKQDRPATASALVANQDGGKCIFCQCSHASEKCKSLKDLEERKTFLIKSARCFTCLRPGHRAFNCRSKVKCSNCKGENHHCAICPTLLPKEPQPKPSSPALDPAAPAWVGKTGSSEGRVALQTALAVVNGKSENRVRVLFDTGSHKSFITAKAVGKLGLRPVRKQCLGIRAFGSKETNVAMRDVVEISLSSSQGKNGIVIEAFVVNDISDIPNVHVEIVKKKFSHLANLWFSDVCRSSDILEVDCLIGSDSLWQFQEGEAIRGGPDEPVAVKTTLGWVLSGPLKGEKFDSINCNVNFCIDSRPVVKEKRELDENLQRLWDLDSLGIREQDKVHENVLDDILFSGKRYSVGLPWKVGHKPLPSNYNVSLQRLKGQVKKLEQTPNIYVQYNDIINEQVKEGIIERVSELETAGKIHYLPHRAVVRENAETTKVRVVYDASSKDRKSGVSLNDCLHVGPSLTPLIFDVLLRFRVNPVALVGDIEKAFLNIEIHPEHRDCLRFLWLNDIHAESPEIVTYRFNRVVFGCNSSPFLLNCVLRHHISRYEEEDPEFVAKMIGGFFVDDLVTGCNDTQGALILYEKARDRLREGGFTLRKWKTNDRELAEKIAQKENEGIEKKPNPNFEDQSFAKEKLGTIGNMSEKTKVLGITWDYNKDIWEFPLDVKDGEIDKGVQATKRGILSSLASLFDPLGLISPIAVSAKILFQELCLEKLGWDDPLPIDKANRWEAWLRDLKGAGSIFVPRCVVSGKKGTLLSRQLHGFADASKRAYCAMVYLVEETTEGTYVQLLSAKTRVAPLKQLTIPRLELMSARVLATLMTTVIEALGRQFKIDCIKYWLDSKTALYWIYNSGEWKQFVQHRVNEILNLTIKDDWGHVAGTENPADLGSRGATARHLRDSKLWWQGPQWLRLGKNSWPSSFLVEESTDVGSERRKNVPVLVSVEKEWKGVSTVVNVERYSTLIKLLRVTAYVQRFIRNLQCIRGGRQVNVGPLSVQEIETAEKVWIQDSQKRLRDSEDYKKVSIQLGVTKENELLVCKGGLGNADLDFRSKFPILLPKNNAFTDLMIKDCHERVQHNKLRSTLAELRSKFWVPQGRQQVKKVIGKCLTCKRLDGKAFKPGPVGELPNFRVTETLPFSNTGVDFAGPLYVKNDTGGVGKVYIVLFTCCVTRAVHLELVAHMDTSAFINCLRRFCSRRGTPRLINSDNAMTFKAADQLLKKLANNYTFQDFLQYRRIKWKFNLPLSPWWGGYFERMVGCVKRCLRKVLGNSRLTYDELSTVLTEVESTLNSRPLTYLYDELGEALTPSHLLHGHRLSALSEGIDSEVEPNDVKEKISKRFLYLTKLLTHFWNRWRREYMTDLREYHKLADCKTVPVRQGQLVLLQEENVKRGQWKVAVVDDVIYGRNGEPRGAVIRKSGGKRGKLELLRRPLQKLYPLEISTHSEAKEKSEELERKNEQGGVRRENEKNGRMRRAAAKDARWKSKLMLDP